MRITHLDLANFDMTLMSERLKRVRLAKNISKNLFKFENLFQTGVVCCFDTRFACLVLVESKYEISSHLDLI